MFDDELRSVDAEFISAFGESVVIDGVRRTAIFDIEEFETESGFVKEPVLYVSEIDSKKTEAGSTVKVRNTNYTVRHIRVSNDSMKELVLQRA